MKKKYMAVFIVLLLITAFTSSCKSGKPAESEPQSEFTPPPFTDDIYVGILYEGTFYKTLYPKQITDAPADATEVGEIESQTLLKTTVPYNEKQTNCLNLPIGSELFLSDDTLYAYNAETGTYWIFPTE